MKWVYNFNLDRWYHFMPILSYIYFAFACHILIDGPEFIKQISSFINLSKYLLFISLCSMYKLLSVARVTSVFECVNAFLYCSFICMLEFIFFLVNKYVPHGVVNVILC